MKSPFFSSVSHMMLWSLKPHKWASLMAVLLSIGCGFWGPINSFCIKEILNRLPEAASDIHYLIWPAIGLVLNFLVFDNVTWRTIGYIHATRTPVIQNRLITEATAILLNQSQSFFQEKNSGQITKTLFNLADGFEIFFKKASTHFFRGLFLLFNALVMTWWVHPGFAGILMLWITSIGFLSFGLLPRIALSSQKLSHVEAETSGLLVDLLKNHETVRCFSQNSHEIERLRMSLEPYKQAYQKHHLNNNTLYIWQGLSIGVLLGSCLAVLIFLYGQNKVTIGDFALIMSLSFEVGHTLWHSLSYLEDFNKAWGRCKQALELLQVPCDLQDAPEAKDFIYREGRICFENVSFGYPEQPLLFERQSLEILPHQKVGLVGYSGSGKTTFINLILRLFDVQEGGIVIDGQNIRDVTQASLRQAIGLVPQDPALFCRSLMDNLKYGSSEATEQEVIAAAQKAHVDSLIQEFPEGYETLVGEKGTKLSGGQRQRLAMARAFLKKAPILILDEATSALDSQTESDVQWSLLELMQGKTTLVIAHRLSTLLHMDRILVFDQGKIVEDGSHEHLLRQEGLYSKLWKYQVGGFLGDQII